MRERLRSHDGANAVEFALVLPMLALLIFGGIWGGIALSHDLSLSTAAREGARYAATLELSTPPPPPSTAWFTDVLDRVEGEATGSLGPGVPTGRICVAFIDESGSATGRVRTWPGPDTATGECYTDGLSGHARVQVTTERRSDIQAVLINVPVRVHSEAVARYEREVS